MTATSELAPRVEFRGRLVADHYPARHAQAQSITVYADFDDGVQRDRIRYGDPKDRYPGGITYATREERVAYRTQEFHKALKDGNCHLLGIMRDIYGYGHGDPAQVEEYIQAKAALENVRTDHRCPDCDVDVGEFHLPGCDVEVCPQCCGQAIGGCCTRKDEDKNEDEEEET